MLVVGFTAVPAHAASLILANISLGSSGSDVTALQTYLAQDTTLYPQGLISGYYGSLTQAAVIRFQARYGISQTGTVGPITRAKINSLISGQGGGVVGFDDSAPILTGVNVARSNNTLAFNWLTNENATTKLYYGSTYPFLYVTAPIVSAVGASTQHSLLLQGLSPNTTYYYTLESVDANGNVTWTVESPASTQ